MFTKTALMGYLVGAIVTIATMAVVFRVAVLRDFVIPSVPK